MSTLSSRVADIAFEGALAAMTGGAAEREREVAAADFLAKNALHPEGAEGKGPFRLSLALSGQRLAMRFEDPEGEVWEIPLSLKPFKGLIRDYFLICGSHFQALKDGMAHKLEAIDMGRRAIHNEGADILLDMLAGKLHMDFETARRLFTLVCSLQMKEAQAGLNLRHSH